MYQLGPRNSYTSDMALFAHTKQRLYTLLRWSEKYTKTDMVYLSSGTAWSIFGTVVSSIIGLATSVAFANLLPKENYGTYQYVLSTVGLVGIFGLSGIKTAISYASAHGNDSSIFDIIRAKIRWSFISSSISLCVAVYYLAQGNTLLAAAFLIVACFLPWWDVYGNYVAYLQGKKQFGMMMTYEAATTVINALAIIGVVFVTKNILVLLAMYFASWTFARLYFYKRTLAKAPPRPERDASALLYGKHLSLMNIISTIAANIDKILIWNFLGAAEVAIYTFSLAVPLRASSAFAGFNRLYFPKVAEQNFETVRGTLFRKIFFMSILTVSASLAYILIAPYLFKIFFPAYIESVSYTYIAALLIATQPFSLISTALSAHAKKQELYLYSILPPLFQIGLLIALIPRFHIYGAVSALVLTQVLESVLLIVLLLRARK